MALAHLFLPIAVAGCEPPHVMGSHSAINGSDLAESSQPCVVASLPIRSS
jgi:hypothetical protein